ncbi:MAG: glutamate--cysteine ligase [Halioglobus sp.]|nr:glutamate--cysteine ligase [Halioglobus sp.]
MGIEIDRTTFSDSDYADFRAALERDLGFLAALLDTPGFGSGPRSLGAELEMYIVDDNGRPLHANQEILEESGDAQLQLELNRYNLEYNLHPCAFSDNPFSALEGELLDKLAYLRDVAARFGGRVVPIGILPTLRQTDFGPHCITDRRRYHALVRQLLLRRGGKFRIDIRGEDPLELEMTDITLEGANTSFQVHYRVDPEDYADTFNAIQLSTPLAVAIGANSPTLFGHNLWHETRVPLFKQSIDTRYVDRYSWNEPPRVSFGQGWVRRSALELFAEVVCIYPPLLPICTEPGRGTGGDVPALDELRLHQSTVWTWNRPIYDPAQGGHLRIEMRALPAGPTAVDMVANAALLIGLAEGLRPRLRELLPAIPFGIAEYNFYRAAQHGLFARLVWPEKGQSGFREQPVGSLLGRLLPVAQDGLESIGVDAAQARRYLEVIERRLQQRRTGAIWQRSRLSALSRTMSREQALHAMLEEFIAYSNDNTPVSEWRP